MRIVGEANAARLRDPLKARGDVDAVAKDIAVIDDDVADVNADAELDPEFARDLSVLRGHTALDFHCAARGIHSTCEFD
jgi:hypothetical protein